MQNYPLVSRAGLVDIVGAGVMNQHDAGPEVINASVIDDNRIVVATYYDGNEPPDIVSEDDIITDNVALREFIDALLKNGTSFTTQTGVDDMLCTLQWTIREPEK